MNKKWEGYKINEEEVSQIAKNHNISELMAKVIMNRNIPEEKIESFLHPKLSDLYDPFLFNDMDKAVDRILKAIDKKEKITIYGDYDVDGITSATILVKYFTSLNANVDAYLPNRLSEGYGLNEASLDSIRESGTNLLVTVDCGISGYEEVEYAKKLGMDVIITDHHECHERIPDCIAVIDAKRPDSSYPFNGLAGCGVSFKLAQAISKKLKLPDESFLNYLDIVALGTIADIVPLVEENRIIVKYGLEKMKKTENPGLKALINSSALKTIDSSAISFGLAPRINACGRMGQAELALKMLLTDNIKEAVDIATKLQEMNRNRQEIERGIINEAIEQIESEKLNNNKIIVVGKENWHHGVIGIVSSKITESYYKPSILICFEGEEGKGSGRSVDGFDLHAALTACSDYLQKFGGHEMAIGLTLDKSKFEDFRKAICDYAKDKLPDESVPTIRYDAEITCKDVSKETINELKLLEPYGEGNPAPLFAYKNIKVDSIRTLSNDKHLKLNVKDEHRIFSAIAFNMGEKKNSIRMGDKADILCAIEINSYNGIEMIQLNIKDIKKSI
ncbi:MAG: single-stranded-DNA-specific exonuclease RecJ [Clostridia bacterium]|nr:single-stranded-DNA-specific exonuclease RecJ [Clostridia bacterium]